MNWRDVISLITFLEVENEIGDLIKVKERRKVYANKQSIRQSEFYQAHTAGLKPQLAFEIRTIEYSDEESLEYNDKEYSIIRTYDKGEFVELVCEGVVNHGDA